MGQGIEIHCLKVNYMTKRERVRENANECVKKSHICIEEKGLLYITLAPFTAAIPVA